MNIVDAYKEMYNHYTNSESIVPNEFKTDRYRISETVRHCGLYDRFHERNVFNIIDAKAGDGIISGKPQHQIMFNQPVHSSPMTVWIAHSTECVTVQLTPHYIDVSKPIPEKVIWDIADISEEFIFQQSTMIDLPEYGYFEKFKKYFPELSKLAEQDKTVIVINAACDWDNIELTKDNFK